MERLTRKDKRTTSGYYIPNDYSIYHQKEFIKLGKLEDLEEELGIKLITLFKALKEGVYFHTMWGKPEFTKEIPTLEYKYNDYLFCLNFEGKKQVKDYKKTWWLKEDLEDE